MYDFFDNFLDICLFIVLYMVIFSTLYSFFDFNFNDNDLEERVEVLEKYHENENCCLYCNMKGEKNEE
mgnify:CR=1 FL=1